MKSAHLLLAAVAVCLALLPAAATAKSLSYNDVRGTPFTVAYDHRAFTINGERQLIQSGSIHSPRSTPDMWRRLMRLAAENGLNAIETYTFWNIHEPQQGVWDFESPRANITGFLQEAANAGLFVIFRLGPYVCAEWNYGGLPVWLREQPDMVFRTFNENWMTLMDRYMRRVLKEIEPFLARNGGPVILAQVENEYGNIEKAYGTDAARYVKWAATTANNYNISVPWIMCQQDDAPMSVVSTCNGFYCDNWIATSGHKPSQPAAWTENWPGWFQQWGEAVPHRPVQDVAFSVARWIAKGGSLFNYYMLHGGTNFARDVGGPNILTSYDYDVAIDEFGWPAEPKYSHTGALHAVLAKYADVIVGQDAPATIKLGHDLEGHVYSALHQPGCLAFLSNIRNDTARSVSIGGRSFSLPAWSVSLVDCASAAAASWAVLFNSATVGVELLLAERPAAKASLAPVAAAWLPETSIDGRFVIAAQQPLEQIGVTKDESDYLWYSTKVVLTAKSAAAGVAVLEINAQDYFYVFLDDVLVLGLTRGADNVTAFPLNVAGVAAGAHTLKVLSKTAGLVNYGPFLERWQRGVAFGAERAVIFDGADVTHQQWLHRPQLSGEFDRYFEPSVTAQLPWVNGAHPVPARPLTWRRVDFPAAPHALVGESSWALDLSALGTGMVWVNGNMIGRYSNAIAVDAGQCAPCDYRGAFDPSKCRTGCGRPSQALYHVPVAWLNANANVNAGGTGAANTVVLFEETPAGDSSMIKLVQVRGA